MKKLLLIATGGTIASQEKGKGLEPSLKPEKLLDYVSANNAQIDCTELFNIDSTNIDISRWEQLKDCIKANYDRYDGFVVTHGTDTLAYSACAISYLVLNPNKPIVFTGSQKPIDSENTDAVKNLEDSINFACTGYGGVVIVFDGKVIRGDQGKKIKTTEYDAFIGVNCEDIAHINDGNIVINKPSANCDLPFFSSSLCEEVTLIKLTPNLSPDILAYALRRSKGIVIEGYGSGGIPSKYEKLLASQSCSDKLIVVATQCMYNGTYLTKYRVGKEAFDKYLLLEAGKMTPEHALVKLMYCIRKQEEGFNARDLFLSEIVKYS